MALRLIDRAYRMTDSHSTGVDSRVYLLKARMLARNGDAGRMKAQELLESYERSCTDPGVADWVRSCIAQLRFDLGDPDGAIDLATEAYDRECDRSGFEARFRLRELARLLVRAHRADEAMDRLKRSWKPAVDLPYYAYLDDLLLAEIRHASGNTEGALRALDDARELVVSKSYSYLLPQIDRVERKLATA